MRRKHIIHICFFVIGAIWITSCNDKNVLSRDKMVAVLHDIQVAEAIHQVRHQDYRLKEDKDALIDGVLQKHGITLAQLDSSLVWYSDNVEIYNRVNDSIISTLKREKDLATNQWERYQQLSNTNSGSLLPSYFYLTNATPVLSFNIDSAQVDSYPDFDLQLRALWVQEDTDAEFAVSFTYADTVIVDSRKLLPVDSLLYQINKPDVQDSTLSRISGHIRLNNQEIIDQRVLLYDIKLRDRIKVESDTIRADSLRVE